MTLFVCMNSIYAAYDTNLCLTRDPGSVLLVGKAGMKLLQKVLQARSGKHASAGLYPRTGPPARPCPTLRPPNGTFVFRPGKAASANRIPAGREALAGCPNPPVASNPAPATCGGPVVGFNPAPAPGGDRLVDSSLPSAERGGPSVDFNPASAACGGPLVESNWAFAARTNPFLNA